MALILRIENETNLPDGGPISLTVSGRRNVDIGRDSHLDWTLPDPTRHISSKHCEIRYKEAGYWLHDVSTNGTFLNGSDHRMQAPHRLRTGDRFAIGQYIIGAHVEGEEAAASPRRGRGGAELSGAMGRGRKRCTADRPGAAQAEKGTAVGQSRFPRLGGRRSGYQPPPPPRFRRQPAAPATSPPTRTWTGRAGRSRRSRRPRAAAADAAPRRPVWVAAEPDGPWGGDPPSQRPRRAPDVARSAPTRRRPIPPGAHRPQGAPSRTCRQRRWRSASPRARGVPEEFFAGRSPEELAELFGQVMRLVVENMMQLLNARVQAKRLARSSNQTMIEALDNNPLKFSPTAEDAMRIMFGPPTRSYLDALRALRAELRRSQEPPDQDLLGDAAGAAACWSTDLDPQTIEQRGRGGSRHRGAGRVAQGEAVGRLCGALAGQDAARQEAG